MTAKPADALPEVEKPRRDIPSLDGLRALSIALVMLSHGAWIFPDWFESLTPVRLVIGTGRRQGVVIFFIISGFLITSLLMREREKTGTISLKRFYFRRCLRIFPPLYVFLAVMGILWATGIIPEHWPSFLAASTFTWTYYPFAHGFEIGHLWSLSIEEQFYFMWPLAFLLLARKGKSIGAAIFLIVLMPFLRLAFYFAVPSMRGFEANMLQQWTDALMIGCLFAMIRSNPDWKRWKARYLNGWVALGLAILGLLGIPWISEVLPHAIGRGFGISLGMSISALSIGGMLIFVVDHPESIGGRILNFAPIRHIGVISYSLYLWQQIFMSWNTQLLPWGFLYAFLAAEASFWLVEKPSMRLRSRLEPLIGFSRPAKPTAVTQMS
jgi:peptidoglycan/LPS O-acetylase OafA/YrhL